MIISTYCCPIGITAIKLERKESLIIKKKWTSEFCIILACLMHVVVVGLCHNRVVRHATFCSHHQCNSHRKRYLKSQYNFKHIRAYSSFIGSFTTTKLYNDKNHEKESCFAPPKYIDQLTVAPPPAQEQITDAHNSNKFYIDSNYQLNFTRIDTYNTSIPIQIRRISHSPHIFHIQNFISPLERQTLLSSVQNISSTSSDSKSGIRREDAGTVSSTDSTTVRRNSTVYWISPRKSEITQALIRACASLLLSPSLFQPPPSSSSQIPSEMNGDEGQKMVHYTFLGCEDLQMVHYTRGGEFAFHHDGIPRLLTVIYYLNGVAGTWFPLAKTKVPTKPTTTTTAAKMGNYDHTKNRTGHENDNLDSSNPIPINKRQALEQIKDFIPGKDGVLISSSLTSCINTNNTVTTTTWDQGNANKVPIQAGDAIAFYNYLDASLIKKSANADKNWSLDVDEFHGRIDWRALHAALPTDADEKWIASLWFLVQQHYSKN